MRTFSFPEKLGILAKAAVDRRTPLSAKGMLLGGLLYGIFPFDLIPDLLPLLGIADDAVIILAALLAFLHWTKSVREKLEGESMK